MKKIIPCLLLSIPLLTLQNTQAAAPTLANPIPDQIWRGSGLKSFRFPLASFSDADGNTLTYSARLASGAALPSWLRFSPTLRRFSGNPQAGLSALSVRVRVSDGHGGTVSDTFRLSFLATNDAPVAVDDALTVTGTQATSNSLTATDPDGDALTYRIVTNGTQGRAVITNRQTGAFTYTPNPDATGSDSFTFRVYDGRVYSNTATVSVTLVPNTNTAPASSDGELNVRSGAEETYGLLTATDAEGDALTYRIDTPPTLGTVTITNPATGEYTYTPSAEATTGTDTFTFLVNDGQADSNAATVTVTIGDTSNFTSIIAISGTTTTDYTNSYGMTFKQIPAGTFTMGSPTTEPGHQSDEIAHSVTLSRPFYMQSTEVTQGQWKAVMGANPSWNTWCGDSCPVEMVEYEMIQNFISYLNEASPAGTYRLPTEAEWEYAARAGTTTVYSFGNNPRTVGDYGWHADNSGGQTHPVASKLPNPFGLYDMHGNVAEFVAGASYVYPNSAVTDPQPMTDASDYFYRGGRILRGGHWETGSLVTGAYELRSADREIVQYVGGARDNGFRLVWEPPFWQIDTAPIVIPVNNTSVISNEPLTWTMDPLNHQMTVVPLCSIITLRNCP
ncbi:MAG: SUMF1/EgtB/PvdO family nonheme iron enzyme [Magnetococcales bacterium]|nr:SUMF1/EgtB/PvdO family nonheme iron enzyme [Magnetococcales bacterium]